MEGLSRYADAFNIADLRDEGRWHLGTVQTAVELKRQTGLETMPVLTLRDANLPSLMGTISYALYEQIDNLALVRGDPYSNSSGISNVYQIKRVSSFIKHVKQLITRFPRASCDIFAPISLSRTIDDRYVRILLDREEAGADGFLSDPMFGEPSVYLSKIIDLRKKGVKKPVLHNIFPLKDEEDIIFCKSRFGWEIPQEEINVVKSGGIDASLEYCRKKIHTLAKSPDLVDGFYISSRGHLEYFWKLLT
jgi:5,10-methylenetetrahydrofolate reductase